MILRVIGTMAPWNVSFDGSARSRHLLSEVFFADHYDTICRSLDIESRFRALNEKLDYGENLLGVIRALLTERSSHRMELIIIYLIAFEATLAVISHDYVPTPKRIWRLLTGQTWAKAKEPDAPSVPASPEAPAEIGLTIGLLRRALSLLDTKQGDDAQDTDTAILEPSVRRASTRQARLV